MENWKYYQPNFEYKAILFENLDTFGWLGHTRFAYDLVANTKPAVIVELGTHWGVSFFSFCQAVKDLSPKSQMFAVDTWKGEKQAGIYDERVITAVKSIKEEYFKSINIILLRKTFDQALVDFADNSIDLLHIDGLHTYEAVKHDFDNWFPKLTKNAVVLFHDTTEIREGFGVHRLWAEIEKKYSQTILLPHSHGLGILFLDSHPWKIVEPLQDFWRKHYSLAYEADLEFELAKSKAGLTAKNQQNNQLSQFITSLTAQLEATNRQLKDTAQHATNLQATLDDIHNSKAYKFTHGLGNIRRIITKKP